MAVDTKKILAEREKLQRKILKDKEALKAFIDSNRCFFFKPYKWQNRFDQLICRNNVSILAAPNKIGKSAHICNTATAWAKGFEPWSEVDRDYPGAVKSERRYYKPSSLGIKPPVSIRITGADWKYHIGSVLVKELKKWAPRGEYDTKKNEQGVEYFWTWKNGSTFEMLTYTQSYDTSEEWLGHGWLADGPPPQPMYGAMSRGIFLNNGKVVFSMCPLEEAWILDDLILSGRSDIGVIDDLIILDNEDLYADEKNKLIGLGLNEDQMQAYFDLLLYEDKAKERFVEDKGKKARIYLGSTAPLHLQEKINDLKLLRFVQDTPSDLAPSRFGGKFRALIGRILKPWDKSKHWVKSFDVPCDWPIVAMIDFHLNKPQAVSYHAVNRQNVKFIIRERWEHDSPEETADAIIRAKKANAYRLEYAYIDPLSKGDTKYMKNRMGDNLEDSFSIIQRRLAEHDITLLIASKDKESGIRNILKELEGVNGMPTYYVFDTCERHLFEIMRWIYDEDGKPTKEDDHFMENWYRATLAGLEYTEVRPKQAMREPPMKEHAWLGA